MKDCTVSCLLLELLVGVLNTRNGPMRCLLSQPRSEACLVSRVAEHWS